MRFIKQMHLAICKIGSQIVVSCAKGPQTSKPAKSTMIRNHLWKMRHQTKGFTKMGSQMCWQQLMSQDTIHEPFLKRFLISKRVPTGTLSSGIQTIGSCLLGSFQKGS